jgi:hypothetical protein
MHILLILLNPAVVGIVMLFLSVIWMLMDEKDKVRPLLVFALTLNLFFGVLLKIFMGREGSHLPFKFDFILFRIDQALGVSTQMIAIPLHGSFRIPLFVVYQLMVPMMILWFVITKYRVQTGSVVMAYIAELIAGPILYAVVPACGPLYAFGKLWLHPASVAAIPVKLAGMPNAFPSLHIATAIVLVLFAPGIWYRALALAFLAGTGLATLSTGEHYVIDLFPGMLFGCYAAAVGFRHYRKARAFLLAALGWSLLVRYASPFLISHPYFLRAITLMTAGVVAAHIILSWKFEPVPGMGNSVDPGYAQTELAPETDPG